MAEWWGKESVGLLSLFLHGVSLLMDLDGMKCAGDWSNVNPKRVRKIERERGGREGVGGG